MGERTPQDVRDALRDLGHDDRALMIAVSRCAPCAGSVLLHAWRVDRGPGRGEVRIVELKGRLQGLRAASLVDDGVELRLTALGDRVAAYLRVTAHLREQRRKPRPPTSLEEPSRRRTGSFGRPGRRKQGRAPTAAELRAHIARHGPTATGELAKRFDVSPPTTRRACKGAGLVSRGKTVQARWHLDDEHLDVQPEPLPVATSPVDALLQRLGAILGCDATEPAVFAALQSVVSPDRAERGP
jgi:hypothetical protein